MELISWEIHQQSHQVVHIIWIIHHQHSHIGQRQEVAHGTNHIQ